MKKTIIKAAYTIGILSIIAFSTTLYIPEFQILGNEYNTPVPEFASFRLSNVISQSEEFDHVDEVIEGFLRRYSIAGASVAIAKDDRLIFAKGYGYADKELQTETEPYNLFRIASISKLITAVGIMKLVEKDKLNLDDKVFGSTGILNDSIYLNYKDRRVENITVKHLLEHSGGWTPRYGDHMFMPTVVAKKLNKELPVNMQDIIEFALMHRLHFEPGTYSSYSNLGYGILGEVISKITGLEYETYIRNEVLFPLGIFDMQIAGSFLSERKELEVKYYEPDNSILVPDYLGLGQQVSRTYGGNDMHTLGPAGGWIASSTDLMKLMLSINGDNRFKDILANESIETMVHPDEADKSPLGWRRIRQDSWIRTGTLASVSAQMVYDHNDGISWVILMNSGSWRGPEFSHYTYQYMKKAISQLNEWPDYDLFDLEKVTASTSNRQRSEIIF